ncbi:MAG TPA: hypothetical protein VFB62_14165, partial [Polyangiaceae bacterium]|nr:hypothetical protein [Polyangiaceae bacterium]
MKLLELAQRGVLEPLDLHFALAMGRIADEGRDEVLLAAALASRAVREGHVCLDLGRVGREPLLDQEEMPIDIAVPQLDAWLETLRASRLVGAGGEPTPLVLEADRLYLHRYFDYERRLARALRAHAVAADDVDTAVLEDGLARLFSDRAAEEDDQCRAARVVLTRRLAVISGGPGTGKTTTV